MGYDAAIFLYFIEAAIAKQVLHLYACSLFQYGHLHHRYWLYENSIFCVVPSASLAPTP
jgi:hypothetical protein